MGDPNDGLVTCVFDGHHKMKISKLRQHHLKCGQQPDFKDKWFFCSADGETVLSKKDRKQHLESCKDCRDDPEKNGSNPSSTKEASKKKKHDPHVVSNPVVDNLFNKNLMLKIPLRMPKELTKAERKEWNEADRQRRPLSFCVQLIDATDVIMSREFVFHYVVVPSFHDQPRSIPSSQPW